MKFTLGAVLIVLGLFTQKAESTCTSSVSSFICYSGVDNCV